MVYTMCFGNCQTYLPVKLKRVGECYYFQLPKELYGAIILYFVSWQLLSLNSFETHKIYLTRQYKNLTRQIKHKSKLP